MKKFLAAAVLVVNLFFFSTADAQIKTFSATAEEIFSEFETEEVIKLRTRDKAIKIASASAKDDFKKIFGNVLTDDEISAIIFNAYVLDEVQYNLNGKSCSATINFKIDDAEAKNFLRRTDREKFTLINQTLEQEKIFAANDERAVKLRERAANVKKREEKKFFKAEFEYVNNEFLSNHKIAAGNKFFYRGRIDDAINLYTEAVTLNEYSSAAFNRRGNLYNVKAAREKNIPVAESNRRQAINDLDKASRLDNNGAEIFNNRGYVYLGGKFFGQAVKDFNRAIQLAPNEPWNYIYRAQCLLSTEKTLAAADFDKAVELAPKNSYVYSARGNFFEDEKNFSRAAEDFSRAIEFSRTDDERALNFNGRGGVYQQEKNFGRAIEDYSRAIELFEREEQKNPLLPWIYRKRGECYQLLGDGAKSQADFKKFGELQRR